MTKEEGGRDRKDALRGLRGKEQRNDGKDTEGQERRTGRGQMGVERLWKEREGSQPGYLAFYRAYQRK